MMLCIDSGNTRIKWGVHDGCKWLAQGALNHAEVASLAQILNDWTPRRIKLSNVAGASIGAAIRQALLPCAAPIEEARSVASEHGVRNNYEVPARLGVDRWCALLGARAMTTAPCLVVMAGTATTIDTLDADGQFLGGLILPGLDLMRRSLARDTAALPLADGKHQPNPRNTDDAIMSGCLEAQLGAIERAFARLPQATTACCLLSGGAAQQLAPLLDIPHRLIDNLVLEGLARQIVSQYS